MKNLKFGLTLTAAVLSLFLLAACGPLLNLSPGKSATTLYDLKPLAKTEDAKTPLPVTLLVETPQASGSLDQTRIALKPTPLEVKYFGKVKWSDRAPKMMQDLLVASFENTGALQSVGTESIGIPADYRLKINLRDMEANYPSPNATPMIVVSLSLRLVSKSPLRLVDQTVITKSVKARHNHLPDIMKAFDEATTAVLQETVDWTAAAIAKKQPQVK